jgi:YidC/Oxa1 family membrane protein insertase
MSWLTIIFIQPFFNVLIGSYWLLGHTKLGADMGISVIILTIVIRLVLLPVTWASDRSEQERRDIHKRYEDIEKDYADSPGKRRDLIQTLMRGNRRVIIAEGFMLAIQVYIAILLWWIFTVGLTPQGYDLFYPWMPKIALDHEFFFIGFSLNRPHWQFNILQSVLIFCVETMGMLTSPYPTTRKDALRYQIILPLVSYAIFSVLPAGKKLFVITTLSFSLVVQLLRAGLRLWHRLFTPPVVEEPEPTVALSQISGIVANGVFIPSAKAPGDGAAAAAAAGATPADDTENE